ncbi:MAG: hypothetical protein SGPRY_002724 [Prymnesium sp.]
MCASSQSGTSFGTTLLRYANSSLPKDFAVDNGGPCIEGQCDPTRPSIPGVSCSMCKGEVHAISKVPYVYPYPKWFPNMFPQDTPVRAGMGWFGDHEGMSQTRFRNFHGCHFGMFRDPIMRAKSGYIRARENSAIINNKSSPDMTLEQYMPHVEGYVTKMLAGQMEVRRAGSNVYEGRYEYCEAEPMLRNGVAARPCAKVTNASLSIALHRLQGFAFIGMTDAWNKSICLFHLKFGGNCTSHELQNIRKTNSSAMHEVNRLRASFRDRYDSAVFHSAQNLFLSDIKRYGVNKKRCDAINCPFSVI